MHNGSLSREVQPTPCPTIKTMPVCPHLAHGLVSIAARALTTERASLRRNPSTWAVQASRQAAVQPLATSVGT